MVGLDSDGEVTSSLVKVQGDELLGRRLAKLELHRDGVGGLVLRSSGVGLADCVGGETWVGE